MDKFGYVVYFSSVWATLTLSFTSDDDDDNDSHYFHYSVISLFNVSLNVFLKKILIKLFKL